MRSGRESRSSARPPTIWKSPCAASRSGPLLRQPRSRLRATVRTALTDGGDAGASGPAALTRRQGRLGWSLRAAAVFLFAAGVVLGYLFIPLAAVFLLDFSVEGVRPLLGLSDYIGFVTTFLLAFGIALQFPVILYLLARVGILSYAFLGSRRRYVILLIVLVAIVITPGAPVVTSV